MDLDEDNNTKHELLPGFQENIETKNNLPDIECIDQDNKWLYQYCQVNPTQRTDACKPSCGTRRGDKTPRKDSGYQLARISCIHIQYVMSGKLCVMFKT